MIELNKKYLCSECLGHTANHTLEDRIECLENLSQKLIEKLDEKNILLYEYESKENGGIKFKWSN